MPKRLLGFDPQTGLKTYHDYDHQAKQTIISYEHADVEPLLDWNKFIQNHEKDHNRKRDIWHAATIPESIIIKWRVEDGIDIYNPDHRDALKKKLNDPSWKYLRTWDGVI